MLVGRMRKRSEIPADDLRVLNGMLFLRALLIESPLLKIGRLSKSGSKMKTFVLCPSDNVQI